MAEHLKLHRNELAIDIELVRNLVGRDFPEYAILPVVPLRATGSTNVQYRLGDEFLVRLPRQPGQGAVIEKELKWTRAIGKELPVDVPEIIGIGNPGFDYPEQWSIVRWIEGEHPGLYSGGGDKSSEMEPLAEDLAAVVRALRALPIPEGVSEDKSLHSSLHSYRGDPLVAYDNQMHRAIEACRKIEGLDLDLDAALRVWEEALDLPGADGTGEIAWYHGDLVRENLLLANGRLVAVLDFGGLSVGDPTVDLSGAWEMLDPSARQLFRERMGVDDAEWLRARAWGMAIACMTFAYYWNTMPGRIADRLALGRSVLEDDDR